jgi:putative nucleotidyltransferase with HDIG domain
MAVLASPREDDKRLGHRRQPTRLVRSLIGAIEAKDSYTHGHSERVARVAVELGRELRLTNPELEDIYLAGLLHDIGKIEIPDTLLSKRGPLTSEESVQIRQHVLIGCRILGDVHAVSHLLPVIRSHHERYDGRGYPHGLSGKAIPWLARILAVADCYDAMNSTRPYRAALARDLIEDNFREGRDRQWDSTVVEAFFRACDRIDSIHERDSGRSIWLAHKPARNIFHRHDSSPRSGRVGHDGIEGGNGRMHPIAGNTAELGVS